MKYRQFGVLAPSAVLGLVATSVSAQTYPDRPIPVIVPFSPGRGTDAVVRAVMRKVGESIGQPIIIDNKPRAGGMLGLGEVSRARPDGYTLGTAGSGFDLRAVASDNPAAHQFPELDRIAPLASSPMALIASNSTPGMTPAELFTWAKANASTPLAYGSPGIVTAHHLAGVLLAANQGVTPIHVPDKGTAPLMQDVVGGQLPLGLVSLAGAVPFSQNCKLKSLAVIAPKRSSLAPEIPTLAEGGVKGFDATYWYDISAPKGVPKPIMERLRSEIVLALRDPAVRDVLKSGGFEPMIMSSMAEYDRALQEYSVTWSDVIGKHQIKSGE